MRPLPSLQELLALGNLPRVHPNGFIQLDLDVVHRLHVWHPALPYRQMTYSPIHDHVFGFTSRCYSGRIVHVPYNVAPDSKGGSHVLWEAVCLDGEETILAPIDNKRVHLWYDQRNDRPVVEVAQPGDTYYFEPFEFHEILFNEPSLTIIAKHDRTIYQGNPRRPRIAVPFGEQPDNDFRRGDADVHVLWTLIGEAYPCSTS